ncbi:AAA family ATPase [Pseudoalteromonas sp. T1lg22]|uniref:AAA family ATPase n=1 Tax=Pseudoalteromonas sp. T1lg22 TaxID=2077096 RepID=UPI001319C7E4|nr:AAA family ATPase [Pseudoalteromonas sp. T1lg22]
MKIENIQGIIPFTDKKIAIDLDGKNLIITGKNGCGKTQLLESVFEVLLKSPTFIAHKKNDFDRDKNNKQNYLKNIQSYETHITKQTQELEQQENQLTTRKENLNESQIRQIKKHILQYQENIKRYKQEIDNSYQAIKQQEENTSAQLLELRTHKEVVKDITTKETIISYIESDNIVTLFMFFDASRQSGFQPVQNITSLERERNNIIQQTNQLKQNRGKSNAGSLIERFLANWEVKSALRERKKDFSVTNELEAWKERFVKQLKVLLDDDSTDIHFDDETLNYSISQKHKMPFSFRNLSAGYSSILKVFTELLMTVEVSEFTPEKINGFVVIDEVDAHLHPSLQRKVLPFFSELFPNIQFIVSTHSPFVISSESNSVVYDLSTTTLIDDDLRTYSTDVILDAILEVPNYSVYLENILNKLDDEAFVNKNIIEIQKLLKNPEFLDDESQVQLAAAYSKFKQS